MGNDRPDQVYPAALGPKHSIGEQHTRRFRITHVAALQRFERSTLNGDAAKEAPLPVGDILGKFAVETDARVEPTLPLDPVTSRRYGSARLTLFEPPS